MVYQYKGSVLDAQQPLPPEQKRPKPLTGCGTPAGYRAHRRANEPVCDACSSAYKTDQKARYYARRAAQKAAAE